MWLSKWLTVYFHKGEINEKITISPMAVSIVMFVMPISAGLLVTSQPASGHHMPYGTRKCLPRRVCEPDLNPRHSTWWLDL